MEIRREQDTKRNNNKIAAEQTMKTMIKKSVVSLSLPWYWLNLTQSRCRMSAHGVFLFGCVYCEFDRERSLDTMCTTCEGFHLNYVKKIRFICLLSTFASIFCVISFTVHVPFDHFPNNKFSLVDCVAERNLRAKKKQNKTQKWMNLHANVIII